MSSLISLVSKGRGGSRSSVPEGSVGILSYLLCEKSQEVSDAERKRERYRSEAELTVSLLGNGRDSLLDGLGNVVGSVL